MKAQLQATLVVLLIALLTRQSWTLPLLVANAVVGAAYMVAERNPLRTDGSALLGKRLRLTYAGNVAVNLLTHGFLTAIAAYALDHTTPIDWKPVLAFETLGLLLIDLDAVYPTRHTLQPYIIAHITLVLATTYLLAQRTKGT